MAATKLSIYNAALSHIGERRLSSLTEQREPRRVLDDHYPEAVAACLETGRWDWARRTAQIDASTSVAGDFGYSNAFAKPTDWVRTLDVSADEFLNTPLVQYRFERGYWYAEVDPIYVQYISNDAEYGLDLSQWSQLFEDFVAVELAFRICSRISGAESKVEGLRKLRKIARGEARDNTNANLPPEPQPTGSWVLSRGGSSNRSRWDRRS